MSVKELVESVRRAAEAAGLAIPLAKARNAIAFMLYGANYSAVLAAEKAGKAPAAAIVELRARDGGSRYRFDPQLILKAARAHPALSATSAAGDMPGLSAKAADLLAQAGVHDSKGHTRVLCALVSGDRISVMLLGKSTSLGASMHIDRLLLTTSEGQQVAFARMNKDGEVHAWQGRTPLHPTPEKKPGYYPNWYLPDMAREVDVARRLGTLRLDPLLAGERVVDGALPLRIASAPRGDRLDSAFAAPAPSRPLLDFPTMPHGLSRMVNLLPMKERARRINDVLGPKPSSTPVHRADEGGFNRHLEGQRQYSEALRGLLAPAPQELPQGLLEGSVFARAWLFAHKGHRDYDTPDNGQYLAIVALTPQGVLHVRRFFDTFDLELLPATLQHANTDACMRRDDQLYDLSMLANRKADADATSNFASYYFHERDANAAVRDFIAVEEARLLAIGESIYDALVPGLRDEFVDVEDYNLLHAAGDSEKAIARKQMATSVWGGLGMLLSDTAAGKQLLEKVDARFKLHAAAAKVLGVRRWVVRRLTTTDPAVLNALVDKFIGGFLPQFIQWLGPNVKVRTIFDVNKLKEMYRFTVAKGRFGRGQTSFHVRFRTELIGRTVEAVGLDEAVRLVRGAIASGLDAEEVTDYFAFVDQCIEAAVEERVQHLNPPSPDTRLIKARIALFATSNLEDVIRWASRYHDLVVRLPVAAPTPNARSKPIPQLMPPTLLPRSGWRAQQLTSYEALSDEGTQMQHCVRTYHGKMASMASAIFALRGLDDSDRVTVEVDRGGIAGWRLLQARGYRNVTIAPGSDGHVALDEFLEALERATSAADSVLVEQYKKARIKADRQRDKPFVEELLESYGSRAWELIRNTMPGSAHGRIESKLWDAVVVGNRDMPRLVQEHDQRFEPVESQAARDFFFSAMSKDLPSDRR